MYDGSSSLPAPPGAAPGDLFEVPAQRAIEREWARAVSGDAPGVGGPALLRPAIVSSWARSQAAGVEAALGRAPSALGEDALHRARTEADWLPLVGDVLASQTRDFIGAGNVLAIFDGQGRMLQAEGDPEALDGLAEINFAPGSLWSEAAAGTNGPGTALALGRPVHVVGREHFCTGWQSWHCAASPVRDPATGEVVAVVDLSGRMGDGSPYALTLATAFAVALEQRLGARAAEDHARVLTYWADLVARFPRDGVVAVSLDGRVLARTRIDGENGGSWPDAAGALASLVRTGGRRLPPDPTLPVLGSRVVDVHPVSDGHRVLAACIVVPRGSRVRPPAPSDLRPTGRESSTPQDDQAEGGSPPPGRARYTLDDLIGSSPPIHHVRRLARACGRTDLSVLLLGASGTGKELVAQGIHNASPRAGGPFVAVNCAALPRDLVASELFGYVGGAFSGARHEGAPGKFHAADGGTLFLDEVGELPPDAQAALLRALQEGVVTRVGEPHGQRLSVRVVAATNRDLERRIGDGAFREDLYHRLAVLTVQLPTLAERVQDIPALVAHFLAEANAPLAVPRAFTTGAVEALQRHTWPGNVRELGNLVRRLVVLSDGPDIGIEQLPSALRDPPLDAGQTPSAPAHAADREDGAASRGAGAAHRPPGPRSSAPAPTPDERERRQIQEAIATSSTMAAAAGALGITRSTLYRRMARLGLRPGRTARRAP